MEVKIYSVAELTRTIRNLLERGIGFVWLEGEVSNLIYHPSGHVYCTLKDDQCQLNAVLFRNEASRLRFRIRDGMQVQGYGRVTVYERRGSYQIILETLQPAGTGNLQAAFEALKKKLEAEGLFDPSRKRPLPAFPQTIGVVTSPSGAAIRDFYRVLHRRFPGLRILLAPTPVQGAGAAQEIAAAIDLLNLVEASGSGIHIDVIAVIRGGGSLEDLWAFNEEVVARAVTRSKIPIISGVGHEIDFTICDFVADVRAATPSAAAEILIRPKVEFISEILDLARSLHRCTRIALGQIRHRLVDAREKLRHSEPRHFIRQWRQRLDEASTSLHKQTHRTLLRRRHQWALASQRFNACSPMLVVEKKRTKFLAIQNRFHQQFRDDCKRLRHRLELATQQLELLSPQATLSRGYSITLDAASRQVIRSIHQLKADQKIITKLSDGESQSTVQNSESKETL